MSHARVPKMYPKLEFALHMGYITPEVIADELGRSVAWLNARRNGKQCFTTQEAYTILRLLGQPESAIVEYFAPISQ